MLSQFIDRSTVRLIKLIANFSLPKVLKQVQTNDLEFPMKSVCRVEVEMSTRKYF